MSTETDPVPSTPPSTGSPAPAGPGERATPARSPGPEPGAARGPGAWMAGRRPPTALVVLTMVGGLAYLATPARRSYNADHFSWYIDAAVAALIAHGSCCTADPSSYLH